MSDDSAQLSLELLRSRLDETDNELVSIFAKRMELVRQISDVKNAADIAVRDDKREANIVSRVSSLVPPELSRCVESLYKALFEISRSYQIKISEERRS